jgi:hypothetical protein
MVGMTEQQQQQQQLQLQQQRLVAGRPRSFNASSHHAMDDSGMQFLFEQDT